MAAYNDSFLTFSLIPLACSCILACVTFWDTEWLEKSWVLVLLLHALFTTSTILLWSLGEARIVYDTKAQERSRLFNIHLAMDEDDETDQEYEYAAVLQAATRRKLSLRNHIDPPPAPTKPTKSAAAIKVSS